MFPVPLPYERGFLITGNYRVGGVDFTADSVPPTDGFATGQILFNTNNAVPAGSEIVAAFLYWEAIYATWRKADRGRRVPRSRH